MVAARLSRGFQVRDLESDPRAWARPILRWAGSKRALVPLLLRAVPLSYSRYIEPFAGSACLFFATRPETAILGDFNAELIRTYETIARHPRIIARSVMALPPSPKTYYSLRDQDPIELDDLPRAVRFVYLNRYCYNGVYRTNRQNRFNVPMGNRVGRPPSESEFVRASIALRSAVFSDTDFETTMAMAKRGDFAYLDPPYSTRAVQGYGEYGYGAFNSHDLDRLLGVLDRASSRGVQLLLSYMDDPEIRGQFRDWSVIELAVQRQVGSSRSRSAVSKEILMSNYIDLEELTAARAN